MGMQEAMMTWMMGRMGTERRIQMMSTVMPSVISRMNSEDVRRMMATLMPAMMPTCFAHMADDDRKAVLNVVKSVANEMETKYGLAP